MTDGFEHAIPTSPLATALRSIYGAALALNEAIESHIAGLRASDDSTIARTGDLLAQAKTGFMIGYATPVAIIAVGQLLLGNPLIAAASTVSMATSPVAITCAAVGAIWMGWRALKPAEQARILEIVHAGLALSVTVVASVIDFVVRQAHALFAKPQLAALREMVRVEAAAFGRSFSQITGSAVDAIIERLPRRPATPQGDDQLLVEVLWHMEQAELVGMLRGTFGRSGDLESQELPELRRLLARSLAEAAAYSWPWATLPTYPQTVALVAKQMDLSSSSRAHVCDLERMILFKVVELSLEKLGERERAKVVLRVEDELAARGIERRVAFGEIVSFVKTGGMDIGGTLGGLVVAGPGIYGVVGLNVLQFIVLKVIVFSGGYVAGGAALLGFGTGGLALAIAGWAGPLGAGLAVLFTAHSMARPAYRKLVPAVCMIAAKRLELNPQRPTIAANP